VSRQPSLPDAETTPGADRELVPVLRYTTSHLPPEARYQAWHRRDWPRANPIYRTSPNEPFDCSWESVQLGQVMFVHTEITGMGWERRKQDIRQSDFDPVIVNLMIEGLAQGDMDGRPFYEPAGAFHFHDLARPSIHVSTASRTYSLVLPRPVAREWLGSLDDLHGLVVQGEAAQMLFAQSAQVHRILSRLTPSQSDRLGRVFLELLAVALSDARPGPADQLSRDEALRRRAAEVIERRLGEGEIGVPDLCAMLNVSRASLFRAFKTHGGVQAYIMAERLNRARAAMADVARAEPIGTIAHRLGFAGASHLSHAFRRHYGMSPSAYRELAASNPDQPDPPGPANG
jgi:AraC-like DNA-binding protein